MDSLFGEGTSLPVRFFIAFIVVFALIGLTAWLIRRFGSGALGGQSARGRVPRLAVIEAGAVDGRRKLVLIRRDNVEHLIMIGGPTDILVEANIVRGQSGRERASSVADNLSRVLAGAASDDSGWPSLQPEPAPAPRPAPVGRSTAPAPLDDSSQWALQPDQSPPPALPKRTRSADPLAGLAAELSVRPTESIAPTVSHQEQPAPRPAPVMEAPRAAPRPAPMPTAPAPAPASQQGADQNLADMAQRLEAALRRPAPAAAATQAPRPAAPTPAVPKPAAEAPRAAPPVTPPAPQPAAPAKAAPEVTPPSSAAAPERASEASAKPAPSPTPAPAKVAAEKPEKSEKPDDVFGSLEEEMANLLGRSTSKPS